MQGQDTQAECRYGDHKRFCQLLSDQGCPSRAEYFPGIDVLDYERDGSGSKIDEIDDSYRNDYQPYGKQ